jgi:multiple sugar transport system permease protein
MTTSMAEQTTRGHAAPRSNRPAVVGRRRRPGAMHLPLILAAVVTAFPFYAMIIISLQPGQPIDLPGSLIPSVISYDSYREVLGSSRIMGWAINSAVYSLASVVLVLVFASMAGYAFAKKKFFGREVIFWSFVAMLMVPYHLTLIPQFIIVSEMGGLNTLWGLTLPTLANVQAMFLMRQFIRDIPDELIEAARIDGAGEFRIYWSVILPQTKPIMATLGTFVFLWHWNDFLWPLVAQRTPDMYVLTVGLNSMQQQDTVLATTMAGAVIIFLPTLLIFIALQRFFVRGVVMSGLK